MKRVVSILLVVLILVNASGYYLLSVSLHINDSEQTLKLSKDEYSGSDAIIIKVPVSVPYSINDNQYESVDGKFAYNHETYRIVKKRMMNDTIFIVCVKDHVEGKIRKQMDEVARSTSDSPQNDKSSFSTLSFIKDYLPVSTSLKNDINPWIVEMGYSSFQNHYSFLLKSIILQPPQA